MYVFGGAIVNDIWKRKDSTYLHIEKWQRLNDRLIAGFTTKQGGVSKGRYHSLNVGFHVHDSRADVTMNRNRIASKIHFPIDSWVCGEQVHQTNIQLVSEADKGKGAADNSSAIKGVDGLITNRPGILCTAFFADCVPLFFYDPSTSFIGIAHAGWRGTVNQMAKHMVEAIQAQGSDPANLLVTIGPCISEEYYEVDEKVVNQIPEKYKKNAVVPNGKQRFLLDLKQLHVDILLQAGVLRNNIDVTNYCTYRDETLFFSHRRDYGKTGRMLGFIGFLP